ncbi:MAG: adenylyltransferase/cytidyltransferase family protein [Nitrospina sp.]|jgi:rfaE bifunctional protein nucleotidyltransferase chain/domain|nr:adenylyltransferase/cytidyltransferase family protein [Nitrospina sp.]
MPNSHEKILSLDTLAERAKELRKQGKKIVLCHGTFDLLHMGHIRYLQSARKEGDILLVTVTDDPYVNKGPGRPVFNCNLRSENLAALSCIDYVAINSAPTAVNIIKKIKPAIYAKGSDYKNSSDDVTGNITLEKNAVEENGGKVIFTDDITFSSTSLLNEHFGVFSQETREYLLNIKNRYSDTDVIEMLRSLGNMKVLVVGDAIVDEYHYTSPLGNSAKGSHLSVKYHYMEQFAGGAIAVANHIAGFTKNVTLMTGLGKNKSYEDFIRSKLLDNINAKFFYWKDAQTIVKRRFIDNDLGKLFEVYFFNDELIAEEMDHETCPWLEQAIKDFDLVIVPDFGHEFISKNMVDILCSKAGYLAVNTQINSGNRGYHVISRYPRADFISLNEPEIRMATHNRHDPIELIAENVGKASQAKCVAVTRGTRGAILLDRQNNSLHPAPILSTKVVDRIGAGDTFLSLAGICLAGGLPEEIATFCASAAAALEIQTVCNREPVNPASLYKYVSTLLK